MKECGKCKTSIKAEVGRTFNSQFLCEDCYINEVMPKMPKSHYGNDAEFMQRLKDSNPVRNQQYH
jgi:hypothetical protein